jgi:hypothetical protein
MTYCKFSKKRPFNRPSVLLGTILGNFYQFLTFFTTFGMFKIYSKSFLSIFDTLKTTLDLNKFTKIRLKKLEG